MKAVRIHAYGHSDQIVFEDISQPEPGPQEVLVRIRDAGVNPVDWKIREGFMAKAAPRALPFTLGQDFCGEVLALGSDVIGVEAGDEVFGFANGAYAEYAVVSPEMFASKPRTIDDVLAATLPTPGLTALQLVNKVVGPTPGMTVLIHGAAGGVGSIATQLCLARGARVIATASARDQAYLMSLGVTRVIDYKTERFEDLVSDVDAVIELVGQDTFVRSIGVVSDGGVIVTTVSSADVPRGRDLRAVRFLMTKNRADLEDLSRLVDKGIVRPRGPRVLPIDAARDAQELSEMGRAASKLVLEVR